MDRSSKPAEAGLRSARADRARKGRAEERSRGARPCITTINDHEHDHEDFESIIVSLPEGLSPDEIVARVERLAREQNILRVKGYVAVPGKPMRLLVQGVGARVRTQFDRPWAPQEERASRLVVIAEHDHINRTAIESVLNG